jgi:cell division protein FtsB
VNTEQIVATIVGLIMGNGAVVYGIARWGIMRAIRYTHLERDVAELQKDLADLLAKHEKTQRDLNGLSQKIDRRTAPRET